MSSTLPEKWMDVDGCRIRYVDEGEGEPVVFLHGLGGKIEDNDACFPFLIGRHRVVAFDSPGTGYSDKPDRSYHIDELVDFALDFTRRLGLEKFFLAGGSQGGMHVLLCCLRAPERVRRALIYSASGVWPARPLLAAFFRALPPAAVMPLMQITSLFWYSPSNPNRKELRRQSLEFMSTMEMPGYGRHVLGCLASQFERDYRPLYAQVRTPVRILWGQHDYGMPVKMGRELVRILPDAELIEVPGAGHNVPIEMPEFFADKTAEFFSAG